MTGIDSDHPSASAISTTGDGGPGGRRRAGFQSKPRKANLERDPGMPASTSEPGNSRSAGVRASAPAALPRSWRAWRRFIEIGDRLTGGAGRHCEHLQAAWPPRYTSSIFQVPRRFWLLAMIDLIQSADALSAAR